MNKEKTALINGCPECGCMGATIHYEKESAVVQCIICDDCGEDLR